MKNFALIFISILLCSTCQSLGAQGSETREAQKDISLEDIYRSGQFYPRTIRGLRSMADGKHYTVREGQTIVKYRYQDGEKVETLLDLATLEQLSSFSGYHFSADESLILLESDVESIYRHSYRAANWIYDRDTKTLTKVAGNRKQQLCSFSPDGSRLAYVRDNDLYIYDIASQKEEQLTSDGEFNHIINGAPDWVYEEEFGFAKAFEWSPDSRRIAYYRFDESRVKTFSMMMFGELYPESYDFKYPKAGEENSLVEIRVCELESREHRVMDIGSETDQYIPRIKWTRDPELLSIMRLNRLQNQLDILHADAADGQSKVVYSESNEYYISEATDKTITYLSDGTSFILNSERSGYFQLYHYDFEKGKLKPITNGDYDVASFMGYDEKARRLYYSSYEESSTEIHVYSIGLDGKKKTRLSTRKGSNSANFSRSFDYYILTHSSANSPHYITLHDKKGKQIRVLEENERMHGTMEKFGFAEVEFMSVPTASGQELNAYMIKPADFDPEKSYPLFMFVYGGPESQNVVDRWNYRSAWFQMLTQKGYIVACVDNRGTNGRGEAFRKATYMELGKYETIDQVEAAQWFGKQDYVDADRIGIFGWSYGGFMTNLCLTKGEGTFAMGISVAPVTSWRYYDTIYTERFMRTPQENPDGYDQNSPINFVDSLQGKLLLVHGSGDDNVHYQNSMDFVEALVQADKQFDMQFYPNKNHGIYGGNTTIHLYTRMTDFIMENL